ncbi:MAG: flippase-like domain-containing protein [Desulfobacterales bacterium]|nr:MAG: flippase-like domain-containing protein [Desulfobacterales bacterium]
MKKNMAIMWLSGVIVSAAALYFAFRHVPLKDLLRYLASIDYFWVLPSVLLVLGGYILRAYRWQIILGSTHRIGFWDAFHPLMIGFMVNCVLPGRVGEVVRPVILQRKAAIPFTTGLATVAVERVFDMALLIILLAATLAVNEINPELNIIVGDHHLNHTTLKAVFTGFVQLGLLLIMGIIMLGIRPTRGVIQRIIQGLPSLFFFAGTRCKMKIRQKLSEPLRQAVENIALGFGLINRPPQMLTCAVMTILIWSLNAFAFYAFALGCPGIDLTLAEITTVMIIICFFIALPSVPGWWGLWEAGGVFALSLFGIAAQDAAGYTLANHALQVFPVILVGLGSAMIAGVSIWRLSYESVAVNKPRSALPPSYSLSRPEGERN